MKLRELECSCSPYPHHPEPPISVSIISAPSFSVAWIIILNSFLSAFGPFSRVASESS